MPTQLQIDLQVAQDRANSLQTQVDDLTKQLNAAHERVAFLENKDPILAENKKLAKEGADWREIAFHFEEKSVRLEAELTEVKAALLARETECRELEQEMERHRELRVGLERMVARLQLDQDARDRVIKAMTANVRLS